MVTLFNFLKSMTPSFFRTGIGWLAHLEEEGSIIPSANKFSISALNASWWANGMVYEGDCHKKNGPTKKGPAGPFFSLKSVLFGPLLLFKYVRV